MGWGPKQAFSVNTASGASTSSLLDIGTNAHRTIAVYAASMSTNAMITVYGTDTVTGTLLPVWERVNTAPVQHQALTIATSTSGAWAILDAPPHRYLAFVTSAVVSGGVSYTVIAQG